jgi:spoIIIJ-associated protein
MAKKGKGRDFYGQEVTTLIEEACREFSVSQEELDIEVLETGSAGIFGLCRKKAHIRVRPKAKSAAPVAEKEVKDVPAPAPEKGARAEGAKEAEPADREKKKTDRKPVQKKSSAKKKKDTAPGKGEEKKNVAKGGQKRSSEPVEPPSDDVLAQVKADIGELLVLMGYPSEVSLQVEDSALRCHIRGEHEEVLVGSEGRTLDSMQYLLRKMMAGVLPERMMLSLDAGDFRKRRARELKERALSLAEEVRETGKTQAIPALNPAERREVHMILQEDKTIRSRSVGDGLFKKVLIYKPGSKSGRSSRKRKRRSSGRSKEN